MNTVNKKILAASFAVPSILLLVICVIHGITPFGDNDLLTSDATGQYIDYFAYLRTIVRFENNIFYTFSKNLGGDMIGLMAYYLMSPLNLIFAVANQESLATVFTVVLIIKLSLCGLSFNYYAQKQGYQGYATLIFSTTYALMGYNVAFCFNMMWLDGVFMLPIILHGIDLIRRERKPYVYVISLAYTIVANYYIGFMVCLFTILYVIHQTVTTQDYKLEMKRCTKSILLYIGASIVAAGASSVVLIPTLFALAGGKAQFDWNLFTWEANFAWPDFFNKFYTGTIDTSRLQEGAPNVYCGMLILLLIGLYFVNSRIRIREKIASGALMAFLVLNFYNNAFDLVWHGFNPPAGFLYRYSFVLLFFMIYVAMRGFYEITGLSVKKLIITAVVVTGLLLVASKIAAYAAIDLVWMLVSTVLILFQMKLQEDWTKQKYVVASMCAFNGLILFLNAALVVGNYMHEDTVAGYTGFVKDISRVVAKMKDSDPSFYRMEKDFYRSNNDAMQFAYNGLSHFSSSEKEFVKVFLGDMGFRNNGNWAYYNRGSTVSAESLLGLKYLMSYGKENKEYSLYEQYELYGKLNVLRNPYALPIGYLVDDAVQEVYNREDENPFAIQNEIWGKMDTENEQIIFQEAEKVTQTLVNLEATEEEDWTTYVKVDVTKDAYIEYVIQIESRDRLYAYMTAPWKQSADIYVNGKEYGAYFDTYNWSVLDVGQYGKGRDITVRVQLTGNVLMMTDAYFYYEDLGALTTYLSKIREGNDYDIDKVSSSTLAVTVNVPGDNQYLMYSIPYEKDWHVYVDGVPVESKVALGSLLAVELEQGEHRVVIQYIPRGFIFGLLITIVCILTIGAYYVFRLLRQVEREEADIMEEVHL